ncbi:MAG TPA: ABC transporter permease subunit, partial [Pseudonocardiaceae bacterium]
ATANGNHSNYCTGSSSTDQVCHQGTPSAPTGPDGQAVADSYYLISGSLTGNGTITAQITSLTGRVSARPSNAAPSLAATRPGLAEWAKAGVIVTSSTTQGAPYAAVLATGGHGIRFQYDYTHDTAGLPGAVDTGSPRWLRLVRTGDTLTGYDSTDARQWTEIGATQLAGLPSTVRIGLFATSPVRYQQDSGEATYATATFDHVTLQGGQSPDTWQGRSIGTGGAEYPTLAPGDYQRSGGSFVVSGSGDLAPAIAGGFASTLSSSMPLAIVVGLIALIVVAVMFVTTEYRRELIRTTFTAIPRRRHVLAAKAVVIGTVAFATGAVAAAIAVPVGEHILRAGGNYVLPATAGTDARVILGTGLLLALTALAVLALGTILRSSAGAVTAGIVVFVLPYIVGSAVGGGAEEWLLRFTPPAGLAILGAYPYSPQVSYAYTMANGYYPLPPWVGLAVLAGYALLTLAVAAALLPRRDA